MSLENQYGYPIPQFTYVPTINQVHSSPPTQQVEASEPGMSPNYPTPLSSYGVSVPVQPLSIDSNKQSQIMVYVICGYDNTDSNNNDVRILSVSFNKKKAIEEAQKLADETYQDELEDFEEDTKREEIWINQQEGRQVLSEYFEKTRKYPSDRNPQGKPHYFSLSNDELIFEAVGGYDRRYVVLKVPLIDQD